ncbi:haloacid dehalogenase type II [Pontibacillus yanchengensis]|uniref:Haloacid dehalogenase n=1 Tax=Pontibacillus yanchengensis Y32 TaxID=1385514 RepID=A0A0A2T9H7_9BACI|nr:haloacid dehalogenase type II [Pontibacillus yanchengensis]KGP72204.1 haloacid dehalogenase [Pontibacillus yanchengensis Y32]
MSVKAFVFDAYGTLFDVHSVQIRLEEMFPNKSEAISQEWRSRQVHYFFIRQLIDGYKPFDQITKWALQDALIVNQVEYSEEDIQEMLEVYKQLQPFPEVKQVLEELKDKQLVIFSNGTMDMLEPLLNYNELDQTLGLLSADQIHIYKPSPHAYQFAIDQLGLQKDEVLFMSSNPWDITGASSFGLHTAWIRRGQAKWPTIDEEPDQIYSDLKGILDWK